MHTPRPQSFPGRRLCAAALLLMLAVPATASESRLRPMPEVLLDAPVNATWAANRAAYFREKGFTGFFFQGILDDLEAPLLQMARPEEEGGGEDLLLREIRVAQARLVESGIPNNYLRVPLAPEADYFTGEAGAAAREHFQQAGIFCAEAGLRGLALDTRPSALFHDHRWDGYSEEALAGGMLAGQARRFGRQIMRDFLRGCPEAELLFLAEDPLAAGPLWFAFFEGLVESVGAADSVPLHLLVQAPAALPPGEFVAWGDRLQQQLLARLEPENRQRWKRQGQISVGLFPISLEGGAFVRHTSVESFRAQLAAAKMASGAYAWIAAPAGGWWELMAEETAGYTVQQGGDAAVHPTPALLDILEVWSARTPLDGLSRLGPTEFQGTRAHVLLGESGAAIAAWGGLAEPLTLRNRFQSVMLTELATRQPTEYFPREDTLHLPPVEGPVLIEGLPLGGYAQPHALWMQPVTPPEHGRTGFELELAHINLTQSPVTGLLELTSTPEFSVGNANFPVQLEPGEAISKRRVVQGMFRAGEAVPLRLTLTVPGATPSATSVALRVQPRELWRAWRDGRITGMTAMPGPARAGVAFSAGGVQGVVVASVRGDLARYAPEGELLWVRRVRAGLEAGPVAGLAHTGGWVSAVADSRGRVYFTTGEGAALSEFVSETALDTRGFAFAPGFNYPFDALILGSGDGNLACVATTGEVLWEMALDAPLNGLAVLPHPALTGSARTGTARKPQAPTRSMHDVLGRRVFVSLGGASPSLMCLDAAGEVLWQQSLDEPATGAPGIGWASADTVAVYLADTDGVVSAFDAQSGELLSSVGTAGALPIHALHVIQATSEGEARVLAADAAEVACFSATLQPLWRVEVPEIVALSFATAHDRLVAVLGDATGRTQFISETGALICEDDRAFGPIRQVLPVFDVDLPQVWAASADGSLRALALDFLKAEPML